MKQELTKTTSLPPMDGFDQDDGDASMGGAASTKFDGATQSLWFYRDGPWIAVECHREAICWRDKKIVDRILQQPGEPPLDIDELNAKIPKSEWEENPFGEPKGPWQLQYSVYLVNPEDGSKIISSDHQLQFHFGQKAAFEDLKSPVKFMRNFRGANVVPVASRQMRTRFGIKIRPHFEILEWRNFGEPSAPALARRLVRFRAPQSQSRPPARSSTTASRGTIPFPEICRNDRAEPGRKPARPTRADMAEMSTRNLDFADGDVEAGLDHILAAENAIHRCIDAIASARIDHGALTGRALDEHLEQLLEIEGDLSRAEGELVDADPHSRF